MSQFLYKNFSGQRIFVVATNTSTQARVTGIAATITGKISKDGGALTNTNDVNPTEIGEGIYAFDLTQSETNADSVVLSPATSTGSTRIDPVFISTSSSIPDVNVVQLSGSSTGADNAELFFTNGGFNASNSQIGSLSATGVDGFTVTQALKLILATAAYSATGATATTGTITFAAPSGLGNRLVMVVDANGNRSSVTLTP